MIMHVYKLTNKINNKIYIGKSNNPEARFKRHIKAASNVPFILHKDTLYIHRAINYHGVNNFALEVIENCTSDKEAFEREIFWIKHYGSNIKNKGYNLNEGGLGGGAPNDEVKTKISNTLKGRINSLSGLFNKLFKIFSLVPGYRQNYYKSANEIKLDSERAMILSQYNLPIESPILNDDLKKRVLELWGFNIFTKEHLADALKFKFETVNYIISRYKNGISTEEQKTENRSNARKGKKHSEEHRQKISSGNMGKIIPEEVKIKISKANSGENNGMWRKTQSKEARKKISEFHKTRVRKPLTEEHKQILREARLNQNMNYSVPEHIKKDVFDAYESGNYTKKDLADKFNLKLSSVKSIIRKFKKK